MKGINNDWYHVGIWLHVNERSQAWLARRLEVHSVTVSKWKRDERIPHTQKLAICHISGCSFDELFN